ncbi:50S ribosomal protein L6 [Candidatus Roizmanbacteria bacterium RIFCSPHIGHO2_12_FULL_44_10]|uniref:50S ribosomal protein L6 n=1 Tax=Candidatus Roizmanbacteria bacterium RIFCSPHIGHO2_12_FULL_44_10 TaxID=1802054 RepID=A0A1F7I8D8_9BACT|nr:MAG: 50S ribosomal protein L6 [Candidatus Roizmanbacteria bacterium RIFCSPHIGHO2_12_FULL_44_10]
MSKIGENPINIADSTQVTVVDGLVTVKGTHGTLTLDIPEGFKVAVSEGVARVIRPSDNKRHRALHGLTRSLIENAIIGVEKPWEKKLQVVGTGYKVKQQGEDLVFEVGFSHSVPFQKVEGIKYEVKGNNLTVMGPNKQQVGEIAFKIRSIRKPDPYKGKGIRYEGEVLKLKPGKKAKTAA